MVSTNSKLAVWLKMTKYL
uniref:Uncharacterized protein n=1 Tax=Timema cristinae TaxID=61476 RepID=A0A7R9DLQ8_TIMCR|nr:unnamed protein product [Timema cristinae]